jgi:hypothetical protein
MRSLLKPARIQLFTICRGFGSSTDFLLFAAFFTGTTSLVLIPVICMVRQIRMPSSKLLHSMAFEQNFSRH